MSEDTLPVAVDALGGDAAPEVVVAGSVESGVPVVLVGPERTISELLSRHGSPANVKVFHAETGIGMDENPQVVRGKKDSSLMVAIKLVKDGACGSVMSAGNTGAFTAGAMVMLGRLPHVRYSAAAIPLPTPSGRSLLLDAGASADPDEVDLVNYAVMGSAYVEGLWGLRNPRVALLSIGEEDNKGNRRVIEAHKLLKASGLNFIGNVQGSDLGSAAADVIVTDGFTGNVALKVAEGVATMIMSVVRDELKVANPVQKLAAGLLRPVLKRIKKRLDWQEYGGGALLGVRGNVVIAHGKSDQRAIASAIRLAAELARTDLLARLTESLERYHSKAGVQAGDPGVSRKGGNSGNRSGAEKVHL